MAVEMTVSRMFANIFSATNLVWACVIGSILIYLSIGNWLGGKAADRFPGHKPFLFLLLICGFTVCLIPVVSRPFLSQGALAMDGLQIHLALRMFLILVVVLFIPMTILGMITPFAFARLSNQQTKTGSISGQVLALSTVGSFAGTLLPVFVTIPRYGTSRSFVLFGGLLILISFLGTAIFCKSPARWLTGLLILAPGLLFLFFPSGIKNTPGQLYEKESAYNYIEILDDGGYTVLRLNEGQAIQSIYHPDVENYYGPWEQVLSAPFFNQPPVEPGTVRSAAILGLAGGTSARQLIQVFPNIEIDGYEIDPEIISAAKKYMALPDQRITIHLDDGRTGLIRSSKKYDIIMADAYRPPYISQNMSTVSFFEIAASKLSGNGILVMNVGRTENNRSLIESIVSTAHQVFPSVYIVDLPDTFNSVIFASRNHISAENLRENYDRLSAALDTPQLLLETLSLAIGNLRTEPEKAGIVFTDDFAPVEEFTNSILLDSIFEPEEKTQREGHE